MLFVDKKGSGSFDTEDILLRVYGALTTQDKLTWAHRRKNYLQILPSGYLKGQNGTFLYCPADKDTRYARAIIISQTGRIRLSSDQDADGKPLQCL
jgi:type IV fimbrial biogenesis protein FimT